MAARVWLSAILLLAGLGCGPKPELVECEPDKRGTGARVNASIGHLDDCLVAQDLSLPLRFEPGDELAVTVAGESMPVDADGRVAVDLTPALLELELERLQDSIGVGPLKIDVLVPITVQTGRRTTELKLRVTLATDAIPWSGLVERRWPAPSSGEATVILQEGAVASPKIIGAATRLADATTVVIVRHAKRPALECGPYVNSPLDGTAPTGRPLPRELEFDGSALEVTVVRPDQGRVASRTFEPACPDASYVMKSQGHDDALLGSSTPPIQVVLDWLAKL